MKKNVLTLIALISACVVHSQVEMGGTTDYTEIESDGTIEFHGNAAAWNDYVVPMSVAKAGNTTPNWETFIDGLYAYKFEDVSQNNEDELQFNIQLPHDWDGSTIYPHIHWAPVDDQSGNVVWGMEYTWVEYNSSARKAFSPSTTITATSESISDDSQMHLITGFSGGITPSGDQDGISSMLIIRLFRNSSNASDTYPSAAAALSFDIHYRANTVGSRQEYSK
ncbi:MAG: hypothetical protein K9J27_11130 [Bacteroidales bacterium]|nr:hypothetical protein [Bacteroidales bacterium]MCF8334344.1 hypothetical protein [Bacteroidales bacterium]